MVNLLDRPAKEPLSPALENHHKMLKIKALSAAIDRAKAGEPGCQTVLMIQRLQRQRAELFATLPPIRLVMRDDLAWFNGSWMPKSEAWYECGWWHGYVMGHLVTGCIGIVGLFLFMWLTK